MSAKPADVMKNFQRTRAEHSAYGRECAKVSRGPGDGGKILRKARERLAKRRLAHSSTINSVGAANAPAYRTPGSMKR